MTDVGAEQRILQWLRLARVRMIGPVLVRRALAGLGSLDAVFGAHVSRLASIDGIGPQRAEAFARGLASAEARADAERELEKARSSGIDILTPEQEPWPPGLRNINDPPILLYVRGVLEKHDALAVGVVGSRNCTLYGREQAERFGALLAGAGITVISGGARGIDTASHEGALRAKGRTIVIQGCGLLHCYPTENAALYARIEKEGRGAVISELPLDAPPEKENFPVRNRLIAGMSLGVLVVEANQKSGSLITARLAAADYGREVFALPGRVDSPASSGTHHLIKTGTAHLVENVQDILDALGDVGEALAKDMAVDKAAPAVEPAAISANVPESRPIGFTAPQAKMLEAMGLEPCNVDDLCERTRMVPAVVMAELTFLQIRGAVRRAAGNEFVRVW